MTPQSDDEMDLRELIVALWSGRVILASVTAAFLALAVVAVLVIPKKYTSTILVSVSNASAAGGSMSGLGAIASQLGGLASLAGISIGEGSSRAEYVAVLQSEALSSRYIRDNDLLPVLFSEDWDEKAKAWKSTDAKKIPTLWKGTQFFNKEVRSVVEEKSTGLVRVSVTWKDPSIAAKWANELVADANEHLRSKKVKESERNIAYLNEEAAKTEVAQVRTAIYSVLESEIQSAMLARGSEEYAFRVINSAVAPEKASSPQPLLWICASAAIGLVLASAFLVVRHALRSGQAQRG